MIFLIGIAAFASTFLGGLFALRLKDRLHLILGFSAGAVIGVAFFDLMPEALGLLNTSYSVMFGTSMVAVGFGLYLLLDRIIVLHRDHHEHTDLHDSQSGRGAWLAGTLSVHSLLDGLGIGLAFHLSPAIGLVVAVAVLTHDFSDGINTVNVVLKNSADRTQALRWLLIDAIAPTIGIFVSFFLHVTNVQLGILLAIFSGFFLYIGTSDLLPESHHGHPVRFTTYATLIGMGVMFAVVHFAG
jgi:ZIP family zinc transporter